MVWLAHKRKHCFLKFCFQSWYKYPLIFTWDLVFMFDSIFPPPPHLGGGELITCKSYLFGPGVPTGPNPFYAAYKSHIITGLFFVIQVAVPSSRWRGIKYILKIPVWIEKLSFCAVVTCLWPPRACVVSSKDERCCNKAYSVHMASRALVVLVFNHTGNAVLGH